MIRMRVDGKSEGLDGGSDVSWSGGMGCCVSGNMCRCRMSS